MCPWNIRKPKSTLDSSSPKRNMERIILACGGKAVNHADDFCAKDLGWCDEVYEQEF